MYFMPVAMAIAMPQNHNVPEVKKPQPNTWLSTMATKAVADEGRLRIKAMTIAAKAITAGNMYK